MATAARPTRREAARPATARAHAARSVRRSRRSDRWEVRSFAVTAAAIAVGFLTAVLYLGQTTGAAATDYGLQALETRRDELRRQSGLLDVQLARLEAPGRIEVEAARLGLVRLPGVPVMRPEDLAARR